MSSQPIEMRHCNHCGQEFPANREFFGSQPNGNLRRKCRQCVRDAVADHAKRNPSAPASRIAQRWGNGGNHWSTINERRRLFSLQNGICVCCGLPLESAIEGQVDHQVPVSRGGEDIQSNISLVHAKCNLEKHNKTLEEHWNWRVKVGLDESPLSWDEINFRQSLN